MGCVIGLGVDGVAALGTSGVRLMSERMDEWSVGSRIRVRSLEEVLGGKRREDGRRRWVVG